MELNRGEIFFIFYIQLWCFYHPPHSFTGRIRIKGIAKNSWYAGLYSATEKIIYPRSTQPLRSFFFWLRSSTKNIFWKKKKIFFQIVSFNHSSIYHACTKIYNIKITRSRRELRYFPPIVSFIHFSHLTTKQI